MKIYVVVPYWDKYAPGYNKPDAAFRDRADAEKHIKDSATPGDVIEVQLQ